MKEEEGQEEYEEVKEEKAGLTGVLQALKHI